MRLLALSALALSSLAACTTMTPREATQGPFLAINNMWVTPTGPGTFRVDTGPSPLDGPSDFWCAAGDYVSRALGQPATKEIYRTSKPPRHRGEGVTFSLDPAGAQPSGVARLGNTSPGFTAGAATGSFCPMIRPVVFP